MVVSIKKLFKEKSPLIRKPDSESGCVTGWTATNLWRKFDTDRSRDKPDTFCKDSRHQSDCYPFDKNSLHSTCC